MIKEENKGYTNISNIIFDLGLTGQEQNLYIAILSFYNKDKGYAFPSYEQLKYRSKLKDNRTLNKAMNKLIALELIQKETLKGIGNKYFLDSGKLHLVENYTTCKVTPPPSVNLHHDLVENYTTTNTNTNTNTNTICSNDEKVVDIKSKKDKKDLEISKMFEKIWIKYPRKEGKGQARKHFKKLLSKYSFEEIERAVTRYANKSTKDKTEKQFIKMGSTFFSIGYEDYLDSNYEETSSMIIDYKPVSDNFD